MHTALYLPYISPISPLHLPYISQVREAAMESALPLLALGCAPTEVALGLGLGARARVRP